MVAPIETERLLLRQVILADENDLFEIFSDDQTCLDGGGKYARKEQDSEFHEWVSSFQTQSRYAVVLKGENKCIGLVSLKNDERAVSAYALGFVMNPRYRRNGYCFEAANAVIENWLETIDVKMFTASCFPYNTASQQLLEGLGFTYEGREQNAMHHAVYGSIDLMCYYKEKK